MASDITQTHSRKHRRRGVPIAGFTVGTETPLPHPPSAQKERAVAGARIFVTYYYYYYYFKESATPNHSEAISPTNFDSAISFRNADN